MLNTHDGARRQPSSTPLSSPASSTSSSLAPTGMKAPTPSARASVSSSGSSDSKDKSKHPIKAKNKTPSPIAAAATAGGKRMCSPAEQRPPPRLSLSGGKKQRARSSSNLRDTWCDMVAAQSLTTSPSTPPTRHRHNQPPASSTTIAAPPCTATPHTHADVHASVHARASISPTAIATPDTPPQHPGTRARAHTGAPAIRIRTVALADLAVDAAVGVVPLRRGHGGGTDDGGDRNGDWDDGGADYDDGNSAGGDHGGTCRKADGVGVGPRHQQEQAPVRGRVAIQPRARLRSHSVGHVPHSPSNTALAGDVINESGRNKGDATASGDGATSDGFNMPASQPTPPQARPPPSSSSSTALKRRSFRSHARRKQQQQHHHQPDNHETQQQIAAHTRAQSTADAQSMSPPAAPVPRVCVGVEDMSGDDNEGQHARDSRRESGGSGMISRCDSSVSRGFLSDADGELKSEDGEMNHGTPHSIGSGHGGDGGDGGGGGGGGDLVHLRSEINLGESRDHEHHQHHHHQRHHHHEHHQQRAVSLINSTPEEQQQQQHHAPLHIHTASTHSIATTASITGVNSNSTTSSNTSSMLHVHLSRSKSVRTLPTYRVPTLHRCLTTDLSHARGMLGRQPHAPLPPIKPSSHPPPDSVAADDDDDDGADGDGGVDRQ
ncbi:hypothetical protein PTSG_13260 [Salpingoeca rosetta]|uniref:Uncharacterized protein n=1 Tax=Salpingoeca rosetta (strain ATCC 50818 / BSB-021) TaxID=946362 RepID=F2UGQ0_SALR5|nr:uncharacterized protein PTSG_13260 [Salpingoeca rosetta]EGD75800.1 hypothetical protein PTSG_13260 [Salpingoeca rosetta]|eukprot:XP_004991721.1 hypothetical protein PTSG_13260 [Salpingoeca rosetta]